MIKTLLFVTTISLFSLTSYADTAPDFKTDKVYELSDVPCIEYMSELAELLKSETGDSVDLSFTLEIKDESLKERFDQEEFIWKAKPEMYFGISLYLVMVVEESGLCSVKGFK
jgi:hypothetical protein